MDVPKIVYVANAKANTVDSWTCTGEMNAIYKGKKELLCILYKGRRSVVLPKRCVFETYEAALAALKK